MMRQTTLWKTPYGINQEVYENDNSSFWVDRMEGDKLIEYVRSTIYADQAGTLYLDESDDEGTTSAVLASLSIAAGVTGKFPWTALTKRWYRFRYVNGATAQTKFRAIKEMAGEGEDVVNAKLTGSLMKGANVATVTTAGTRVQLPILACNKVTIIARRTNGGYIYVGMNTVSSTVFGAELAALDSMDFEVNNLNELWIDSSVDGEGISYVAI